MNERMTFYILLSVLVISGGWWLWADVLKNGHVIREQKKELNTYEERFERLSEVTEGYSTVKERHSMEVTNFDSLTSVIPNRDSYVSVLEEIRRTADQQNIEVKSLSPILDDSYPSIKSNLKFTDKHIERYPVHLSVFGDFLTIGMFLEELLAMPAIVNIGRIQMETELEAGARLSCEMVLYTYMYMDQGSNGP